MFNTGISIFPYIPIRSEPSEQSEMVSQILFGELFSIIQSNEKWSYIKLDFDQYEGWISSSQIKFISKDFADSLNTSNCMIVSDWSCQALNTITKEKIRIPTGGILPLFNQQTNSFVIHNIPFSLRDVIKPRSGSISECAMDLINTPYLWGGRSSFGLDCSGFTQLIYKLFNKRLPRDASQQISVGNTINFLNEAKEGDLAFFDDDEGNITHVGVILKQDTVIHASGSVRIDSIDHQGIYNNEDKKYTHKLRIIKRIAL